MWERTSSVRQGNARLPAGRQGLAKRRRSRLHRGIVFFFILLLLLFAAIIYGLWQSPIRISNIVVYSEDPSLVAYAKEAMRGSYFGIVPRDSIFFFPASRIRAAILAEHLDIAAVSIFRNGFTGISIRPSERVPIARWCASTSSTSSGQANSPQVASSSNTCYVFDAGGYVFAVVSTTTQTINTFVLYAPLTGDTLEPLPAGRQALRATIAHANKIPTVFDFARKLGTLGSPATQVVIREDEVDTYLTSGTRITHILGRENDAFTALVSARDNLNLADGSIEYVDLRFEGRVYLKRK